MKTPPNTNIDPLDDSALNTLFDAAPAAQPTAALTARILRDAAAHQPPTDRRGAAPQRGLFASLAEAIGGWPTLGGLATATLAGLYIGFAQPDLLSGQGAEFVLDLTEEDALIGLLPGDTLFFEEG